MVWAPSLPVKVWWEGRECGCDQRECRSDGRGGSVGVMGRECRSDGRGEVWVCWEGVQCGCDGRRGSVGVGGRGREACVMRERGVIGGCQGVWV